MLGARRRQASEYLRKGLLCRIREVCTFEFFDLTPHRLEDAAGVEKRLTGSSADLSPEIMVGLEEGQELAGFGVCSWPLFNICYCFHRPGYEERRSCCKSAFGLRKPRAMSVSQDADVADS